MRPVKPAIYKFIMLITLLALCSNLTGCYFIMHEKVENKMKENTARINDLEQRVIELERQQAVLMQQVQPTKPLP